MPTLICGSIAYDNIMVFHDRFKNHILPDQIHILNVAFLAPEMRREFGGCAGNIAYNLKLLEWRSADHGDGWRGRRTLSAPARRASISPRTYVRQVEGSFTACFITTDLDDNQITAFHPGAMSFSHFNYVTDASEATLAIAVAPDGRDGMLQHARDLAANNVPLAIRARLPMFSGEDVLHFMDLCDYACFNDYEAKMASDRTAVSAQLAAKVVWR